MNSSFERVSITSERIKEALALRKMRQADLVRASGLDKGSISHYISGKYEPKNEAVYKMAKALDVSEMWLWGYDAPMERPKEQKNNDIMSDVIVRMRTDEEFFEVVETLNNLGKEQLAGVLQMLQAFTK